MFISFYFSDLESCFVVFYVSFYFYLATGRSARDPKIFLFPCLSDSLTESPLISSTSVTWRERNAIGPIKKSMVYYQFNVDTQGTFMSCLAT